MTKSVLVLVLAADVQGYDALVQAIRETWGRMAPGNFRLMYYYGHRQSQPRPSASEVLEIGDTLICGCDEALSSVLSKTLMAYEHVLNRYDFDYTFRCCCGSYLVLAEVEKFLQDKPIEKFYCGIRGGAADTYFASGSGYFLSRDLVKLVVENKNHILGYNYPGYYDDVAIGRFMTEKGISINTEARRMDGSTEIRDGQYHYHFGKLPAFMCEIHRRLEERTRESQSSAVPANDSALSQERPAGA